MNDITLRCSQPWPGGILGRPVVPVHQPRLSHKWESNPTVHCFYFTKSVEQRLYCVPTVERATGVLSVEMCIFWKSKHLFPASDNFFLALFVSSAFHFKYASAERATDVLSVEKCILWKSKHLFPGFYSFSRAFCFQCFSFQLSQLFHQSSQLGFFMYDYWPWTHLQILEKCNCEATQNEKWVCFPISGGPKPKALDRMP